MRVLNRLDEPAVAGGKGRVMGRKGNRVSGKGTGVRGRASLFPILLAVLLAAAACSSDPTGLGEDELPEALFGTWSWISSSGGIAGTTLTPETEGYTQTVTFTAPNQVTMLRDGVTRGTTTFEFVPLMDNGSAVRSAQLLYDESLTGFPEQWVEITETGNLVLSDPCCDGFTSEWSR